MKILCKLNSWLQSLANRYSDFTDRHPLIEWFNGYGELFYIIAFLIFFGISGLVLALLNLF